MNPLRKLFKIFSKKVFTSVDVVWYIVVNKKTGGDKHETENEEHFIQTVRGHTTKVGGAC